MIEFLAVAAGGTIGALLRYTIAALAIRLYGGAFPVGTAIANLGGCLLVGVAWAAAGQFDWPPGTTTFIFVGTLGSLTTFSTYGIECINLFRRGQYVAAAGYLLLSNLGGLLLVLAGLQLGMHFFG